jgi:hypothetical protein
MNSRDADEDGRIGDGREDLDPVVAERLRRGGRSAGEPDREQGEADAGGIGEHVARVGEQRARLLVSSPATTSATR